MTKPKWMAWSLLVLALAGMAMAACQRQAPEHGSASKEVPLSVVEVRIGAFQDGRPVPQTSNAPILANVTLRGAARGQVLKARLLDLRDGGQVGVVERPIARSDQVQPLRFDNVAGWAPGRYMLEVTLDGKLVSQQDVDVMDPVPAPPRAGL